MLLVLQCDPRVPAGIYGEYLREHAVPHRLLRLDAGEPLPPVVEVRAALVLGGTMGVGDEAEHPFLRPLKEWLGRAVAADLPVLGICLGGQLLAAVSGGRVYAGRRGERGVNTVELTEAGCRDPLFAGIDSPMATFHWHDDAFDPPPGAVLLAATATCYGQAFRYRNAWGLQFHPEVDGASVADWAGAASPLVEAFAARAEALRQTGICLLENFLAAFSVR